MAIKDINTPEVASQIDAAMELKKSSNATKAQIAANKAREAAAQQAASTVVLPPTGDPAAVSAPVITNLSFEDRMRERYEKEYAEEKRREQERLNKERLGYGIADISATIGDMIRASEGAPVNPRDWQQIYDNLTAQEKANVNNYQVRMAKLREDARADRKAAAMAAAKAESDKQQREYEVVKDYIERNFKGDQAEKERMLKWLQMIEENKTKIEVANARANGSGSKTPQYTLTMLGNTPYQVPKGETMKNYIYSVVDVLNNPLSYISPLKNYSASLLADQTLSTDPYSYYNKNVVGILREHWDELTEPAKKKIEASILGHGGVKGDAVSSGDNGWNGGDEEYDD